MACCRMVAASVHSTRKVLSPARMRSWAPAWCGRRLVNPWHTSLCKAIPMCLGYRIQPADLSQVNLHGQVMPALPHHSGKEQGMRSAATRRHLRLCERTPSLVNIRSVMEMTADAAGTGQPVWARMTAQQAARSSVLFPPIFGPVSSMVCGAMPALHTCNKFIAIIFRSMISSCLQLLF